MSGNPSPLGHDKDITVLLEAYQAGIFPMADNRESNGFYWVNPDKRGVIPLKHFHLPRRLRRTLKDAPFVIKINKDFATVMQACAEPTPDRPESWINPPLYRLYTRLHSLGYAHSVECWQDGNLVGGLYGVHVGAAFFGESMFSRVKDASKIALVHLAARLRAGGFLLLDIQFITMHLRQFGAVELSHTAFHQCLSEALRHQGDFFSLSDDTPSSILQSISQIS
ncbi:MAG: leucyl/phenylalanyl-tRNA--protein transferase [Parvularculales bacterium]